MDSERRAKDDQCDSSVISGTDTRAVNEQRSRTEHDTLFSQRLGVRARLGRGLALSFHTPSLLHGFSGAEAARLEREGARTRSVPGRNGGLEAGAGEQEWMPRRASSCTPATASSSLESVQRGADAGSYSLLLPSFHDYSLFSIPSPFNLPSAILTRPADNNTLISQTTQHEPPRCARIGGVGGRAVVDVWVRRSDEVRFLCLFRSDFCARVGCIRGALTRCSVCGVIEHGIVRDGMKRGGPRDPLSFLLYPALGFESAILGTARWSGLWSGLSRSVLHGMTSSELLPPLGRARRRLLLPPPSLSLLLLPGLLPLPPTER
ncbi:hypothetical protein B0H13DRAFT_2680557 [Mycena leptocephala]|nr:hypothetical protein B0H13DRAFT_2680557 [Mycena leptocephala]